MPKVTAPLLSFRASGQVAKTLVFSKWRGRAYAREYIIPANPQSTEQTLTRSTFSWLQQVYKLAPALFVAPWLAYSRGKVLTDRNAFTKFNLPGLRDAADLTDFIGSPGALGGLPPASIVVTPGVDTLTVDVTPPDVLPTGWTIASAVAMAILDQEAGVDVAYEIVAGEDVSDPYSIVLATPAVGLHQVRAWLKWTRPDATTAYSPSIDSTGTPT